MTQSARALHQQNSMFVDGMDAPPSSSGLGAGDMSHSGIGGDLEMHRLYPELEIVFDADDNEAHEDEEEEFKLDEFEDDLDQLP